MHARRLSRTLNAYAELAYRSITLNATIDAAKWMMGDRLDYATARNVKTAKTAWRQMESHLRELSATQRSAAFGALNIRA